MMLQPDLYGYHIIHKPQPSFINFYCVHFEIIIETAPDEKAWFAPVEVKFEEPIPSTMKNVGLLKAREIQLEEIPEELIYTNTAHQPVQSREIPVDDTELDISAPALDNIKKIIVAKSQKPISPWEAPEDFEVVIEKITPVQKVMPSTLKPIESIMEEHIEEIPAHALTKVQPLSYELPKRTVRMVFKRPLSVIQGISLYLV